MAAAYAALVSVLQLIHQIQLHHAHWPFFVEKQLRQIESLSKKVRSLQNFLEHSSHGVRSDEAEVLERRIRDAAYAAEDIIELYVVDDIILPPPPKKQFQKKKNKKTNHARSTSQRKKSSTHFSRGLQKVIEGVDFCRKEAMMFEENNKLDDHPSGHLEHSVSLKYPHKVTNNTMVGFDDQLEKMMDMLESYQSNLQIIPITGMGGIGKTTLAKNIYDHRFIVENFDVTSWFTISQAYDIQKILLGLLRKAGVPTNPKEQESGEYHHLGQMLHKHLYGRKYLIVLDDLWSIDAWDELKRFFPDNNNGSRVVVTTRLSNVASYFGSSYVHEMNLLDENTSWRLLCGKLFVHEECPHELEEIGKKIAKNCKGLPLSIAVIGGLLAKSKMTREFWDYVAKNTKQIVSSEDNDRCLEILSLSYSHLPIHLKPCFLYIGVFPEDHKIRVSKLIKLWVAEGFLKPEETNNSLEEVAKEYLKDLADRNLIMVDVWGSIGSIKICSIHDLLRNLCIKEAIREKFFCVTNVRDIHISHDINCYRRIVFYPISDQYQERDNHRIPPALQSTTFVRSVTSDFDWDWSLPLNFRLLRLFKGRIDYIQEGNLVNLRHIDSTNFQTTTISSTIGRLWNLQTLIVLGHVTSAPPEIWELLHLRYLKMEGVVELSAPRSRKEDGEDDYYLVLENLQRLGCILNFKFTEDIIKRIPNIKKLELFYDHINPKLERSGLCLNNLGRLRQLQSLTCTLPLPQLDLFQDLTFPYSLKKLKLYGRNSYHLEDMATKVVLLPNLEKLKLMYFWTGGEWNSVEGNFIRLKYLEICACVNLKCWTTDNSHFPVLERLVLKSVNLENIPSDIGNIATLRLIHLVSCSNSTISSAKEILEEQQSYGNEDLRLSVSGRNR